MISDVPPKNLANTLLTPISRGKCRNNSNNSQEIDPGKVILEITPSINSAVDLPGLTPGIKPPFFFISSAIWLGLTVIAV